MKLPCGKVRVDKSWPDLETFFCGDSNHFLKFGYATIQWIQLISNPVVMNFQFSCKIQLKTIYLKENWGTYQLHFINLLSTLELSGLNP